MQMTVLPAFAMSFPAGSNSTVWVYDAAHEALRNGGDTGLIKL
jgi:hypothetical protein